MLALPLFELHGGNSGSRRGAGKAATKTSKAKFQRKALPSFFTQDSMRSPKDSRLDVPLSALELLPEAEAFVGRWLDGTDDLLAPEESRRLTAAPLDLKEQHDSSGIAAGHRPAYPRSLLPVSRGEVVKGAKRA
jgi:hypothetical protein